jgi:deazaflavin-dependent oxidoreductase (nitroreductase family)
MCREAELWGAVLGHQIATRGLQEPAYPLGFRGSELKGRTLLRRWWQPGRVSADSKRWRVRWLQRYVLNPPAKLVVRWGLVPGYVLIETTGRRSGEPRTTVVGMRIEGSTGWVVAEHGRHAGYVRNIEAHPDVRVCSARRWRPARAAVVPDDDPQARLALFGRTHAATVRRLGTDLLTLRFDLTPT